MENVEINGARYPIELVWSRNRNANARLKEGRIVISIPSRWPKKDKDETFANLLKRAVRSLEKGRWRPEQKKVEFRHGQTLDSMGRRFEIHFVPANRFGCRIRGERIEAGLVESNPDGVRKASNTVRKALTRHLLPDLKARVAGLDSAHFNSGITDIRVRDSFTRWGSCSRDSIMLSFRLLFMPQDILDYVIVHELAHTRYRSHGPRFWALVEKVMPDHREKRKWLRENGWKVLGAESAPPQNNQKSLEEFELEEPY